MCTGKIVEIAHFKATVSTQMSLQTINQKSTVRSRCWRCALINSRTARNVFAVTVNGTRNRKLDFLLFFTASKQVNR